MDLVIFSITSKHSSDFVNNHKAFCDFVYNHKVLIKSKILDSPLLQSRRISSIPNQPISTYQIPPQPCNEFIYFYPNPTTSIVAHHQQATQLFAYIPITQPNHATQSRNPTTLFHTPSIFSIKPLPIVIDFLWNNFVPVVQSQT